jgi:GTP-binding protein Era
VPTAPSPAGRPPCRCLKSRAGPRSSQKSIVIGTRGARLKDVGTRARAEIETLLGRRVYLDLHVRVAKEWQRDPRQLRKLGF